MKEPIRYAALFVLLVLGAVFYWTKAHAQSDSAKANPLPPLKLDTSAPLLLEEPPPAAQKETPSVPIVKPAIRRIMCHDCHINFVDEPLALVHALKDLTCVDCHGESEAHKNDESNSTPPDIMFPRDRMAEQCRECHRSHDAPAAKVIARWQQRNLQKMNAQELACTDCHGEHRMQVRTIRWDRKTGKVIPLPK